VGSQSFDDELVGFVENIHPEERASVEAVLSELAAGIPVAASADGSVRWSHTIGSLTPKASSPSANASD
jgi:hypothetical protein